MFLPQRFIKSKQIDYPFREQTIPFLLDDSFQINNLDDVNSFLKERNDDLVHFYWTNNYYPFNCKRVSQNAYNEMKKSGLSVAMVHGDVTKETEYDSDFPFEYIHDLNDKELYNRITEDISHRHHFYLIGKVKNNGIINEIIFDYSADQFVKSGNVVLKETTTAPVIGSRDDLRSRYVSLNSRRPHNIVPGCISCR